MDSILKEAGECGRYQVIHVIFTQLPRFVAIWSLFFMMFGGLNPGWRCLTLDFDNMTNVNSTPSLGESGFVPNPDRNLTVNQSMNNGIDAFINPDSKHYNGSCSMRHRPICRQVEFNPKSKTIVTAFGLVCDRSWITTAILFAQGVGTFLGPLLGGQVGEKFGRKVAVFGCSVILLLSNLIAIFSVHWAMFASCYFFIGAASSGIMVSASVYTLELLNAKWRGYFGSIPITNIALVLFGFVTAALKDWIYVHIVATFLCVLACVGFFMVTESPRWLFVNGHIQKANKSVFRIAKVNKKQINLDENDFTILREAPERGEEKQRSYTYLDLFRNKETRILIVKFSVIFFLMNVTYISVTFGIKSLPGNYYTNAIEALCIEMGVVLLIGPLLNLIGRRISGLMFAGIGFVSSLSIVLILVVTGAVDTQATALKVFTYAAKSSSQCVCLITCIFSAEQFPTAVRNIAIGALRCFSAVSGLVWPFVIPGSDVKSLTMYFSLTSGFCLVNAILFPTFSETKHSDLKDGLSEKGNICEHNEDKE